MKKRLLMILLVVALLVTAAVFAVQASGTETCPCGCGLALDGGTGWTALTATTEPVDGGHYYAKDTTITRTTKLQIQSKTVVILLDKAELTCSASNFALQVSKVSGGANPKVYIVGKNGAKLTGKGLNQYSTGSIIYTTAGQLHLNGDLTVERATGSTSKAYKGSLIYMSAPVYVNGATLKGGELSDPAADTNNGGTVYMTGQYAEFTMNSGAVHGIKAYAGGAFYVDSSAKLTINNGNVYGADAVKGGAIYSKGTVSIKGGTVQGAVASDRGGAIAVEGGSLTVSGSADIIGTPKTGTASGKGGAISFGSTGAFNMTGGTVRDGYATSGGNIYQTAGTILVTGGTIEDGKAKYGGNINVYNGACNIQDTAAAITISGGTATTDGGNIYLGYATVDSVVYKATSEINLTNATSKISGASATGNGGSIWSGYWLSIDKATIENSSAKNGGAIFVASGSTFFKDGSITGCSATAYGGGVYVYSGKIDMSGGSITGCKATTNGGAGHILGAFNMSGTASVEVSADSKSLSGAGLRVQGTMTMSGTSSIKGLGNTDNTAGYAIDLVGAGKAATLTMSDSATVYSEDNSHRFNINVYNYSSVPKLTINEGWQGEASVMFQASKAYESGAAPGAKIYTDYAAATGAYTGELYAENVYIKAKQLTGRLLANGTQLQVAGTYIRDSKGIEWYLNNAAAVEAYEQGDVIKLVTTEALDLNGKEVYVDFGGKDVAVSDTLGTGKLYGIDTETGFTTKEAAANVTGVAAQPYAVDPLTGKGYVALNGSFYPIQVQMGDVGVNTAVAGTGIYFNSTVKCNPAIESCIKAYGLAASLGAEPNETFYDQGSVSYTFSAGVPAGTFNGYINGILDNGADATTGTTDVLAKGYVLLNINGTEQIVLSDLGQESLQSAMVAINAKWGEMEADDKTAVVKMYKKYAVMGDWDLGNIAGDAV